MPNLTPEEWGIVIEALEQITDNPDHPKFTTAGTIIDKILASGITSELNPPSEH
jgi:hypothetical protein